MAFGRVWSSLVLPYVAACLVGDSSIDIATAKSAGVVVWALPYGYNMGAKIEDSHPLTWLM